MRGGQDQRDDPGRGSAGDENVVRVVSVPAGHPYVTAATADPGILVLPDPRPDGAPAGVWWPPVALDPSWVAAHGADADVLHLHFGMESFSPEHLAATIDAAHDRGWGVVVTVHDLEHPQLSFSEQDHHDAQLAAIVPAADAVITLTESAARIIERRWRRPVSVLAHPRLAVLEPDAVGTAGEPSSRRSIAVHLGDLRPNVSGVETVRLLLRACRAVSVSGAEVDVRITLRKKVRDRAARAEIRRLVAAFESRSIVVELEETARRSDADLERELFRTDVVVLPYAHGTHSGWLELCWDLGVTVLAPTVGHYADQHRDGSVLEFDPADTAAVSLFLALRAALDKPAAARTRGGSAERLRVIDERRAARRASDAVAAAEHASIYRSIVGSRG